MTLMTHGMRVVAACSGTSDKEKSFCGPQPTAGAAGADHRPGRGVYSAVNRCGIEVATACITQGTLPPHDVLCPAEEPSS
jgi:hypothetical protein